MRYLLLTALLLGLGACSDTTPSLGRSMITEGLAKATSGQGRKKMPTAAEIRASATPKALAQIGRPVMLAELPGVGMADILIFVQQNGPHSTWASSDGVTFAFDRGLLTGTRGMGFDLMAADVEEPLDRVKAGGGEGTRVHRYLDGENQLVATAFYCRYARQDNGAIRENCKSRLHEFENQYWLTRDGSIAKSRQWIGPNRGYLVSERLS